MFKHIRGYWCIFSHTHRRTTRGERGEISPTLFENRRKWSDFGKKDLDCVHLWVNFSVQNVVLRVSSWKNSKMFPRGAPFSCVFDEWNVYQSALVPQTFFPCPEKFLVAHLLSGIVLFVKHSILNVWQCFACISVLISSR